MGVRRLSTLYMGMLSVLSPNLGREGLLTGHRRVGRRMEARLIFYCTQRIILAQSYSSVKHSSYNAGVLHYCRTV